MRVWKYRIQRADRFDIPLPEDAVILGADGGRGDGPEMWALVDPDAPLVTRTFVLTGTGHDVPDDVSHVATFRDGFFVWHLWEAVR